MFVSNSAINVATRVGVAATDAECRLEIEAAVERGEIVGTGPNSGFNRRWVTVADLCMPSKGESFLRRISNLKIAKQTPLAPTQIDLGFLRPHQREVVAATLKERKSGAVIMPCGGGKTHVAVSLALSAGVPALCATVSAETADQLAHTFETHGSQNVLVLTPASRVSDVLSAEVAIATYAIFAHLSKELKLLLRNGLVFPYKILDEAHRAPAPCFRAFFEFPAYTTIALTATPLRLDGEWKMLMRALTSNTETPFVNEVKREDQEASGVIARVERVAICTGESADIGPRKVQLLLQLVSNLLDASERVLLFVDRLTPLHAVHAHLVRQFGEDDVLPLIDGDVGDEERTRIYTAFRRRGVTKSAILCLSPVGTTGIDLVNATTVLKFLTPHKSVAEDLQITGRMQRIPEGSAAVSVRQVYALISLSEAAFEEARAKGALQDGLKTRNMPADELVSADTAITVEVAALAVAMAARSGAPSSKRRRKL